MLSAKLAMEFLILTATRSGETRFATWNEIDLDKRVWVIPPERMKMNKPHRVPLSKRALTILQQAQELGGAEGLIFPGMKSDRPLSDNTLSKLLRELGIDCVPHGFRTSFRMWAAEQTNIPREVCEFALAHVVGDEAERAYQRSDLFDKRRKLMDAWDGYLNKQGRGKVVQLREATGGEL
jgi:integrase